MKKIFLLAALTASIVGCARDPLGMSGHYVGDATWQIESTRDIVDSNVDERVESTIVSERAALQIEPGTTSDGVVAGLPAAGSAAGFACQVPVFEEQGGLTLGEAAYCDSDVENIETFDTVRNKAHTVTQWTLNVLNVDRGSDRGTIEVLAAVAADVTTSYNGEAGDTWRIEGQMTFSGDRVAAEAP